MATAAAEFAMEPKEKECSVCHEDFRDPRVLRCGHLLCHHCLLAWLDSKPHAQCPLCRCAIVNPNAQGDLSFADLAESFPVDLAMKAVVDADRILNKDHRCIVCEDVAATAMCVDCGDMLCPACSKAHRKMTVSKHHTVEDLASLTAEKLAEKEQETCQVHVKEPSKVFCSTHSASICLLCATTDHRQCPDVTKLETRMEEARAALGELAAILSAGERELDKAIAELDDHLQETEARTKAAIAEIGQMCDRLEAAVKECRHRLTKLAESACDDVRAAVQDGKTCLLDRRGKLTTHKRVIERSQEMKIRASLAKMASTMKPRVDSLDCSCLLPAEAKTINSVTLTIDQDALSSLEQGLSTLGRVDLDEAILACQQQTGFLFHPNHGTDVTMSSNRKEAKKCGRQQFHGIVFSSRPMGVNGLYEVRIEGSKSMQPGYLLFIGVITSSPDNAILPASGHAFWWKSSIVVGNGAVSVNGVEKQSKFGSTAAYCSQQTGSRIGVALDVRRSLHLNVDGVDLGIAAENVPEPAFALFDLRRSGVKIIALPVTSLR